MNSSGLDRHEQPKLSSLLGYTLSDTSMSIETYLLHRLFNGIWVTLLNGR
jgi:hypothetical protein